MAKSQVLRLDYLASPVMEPRSSHSPNPPPPLPQPPNIVYKDT